jgi:hypothetical protein
VSPICRLQPRVCFMAAEPAIVVVAMTTTQTAIEIMF